MTYNIPPQISGDTWNGLGSVTFSRNGSAIDLTDAFVEMAVKYSVASPQVLYLNSLPNSGIVISSPTTGTISVLPMIVNIPVGKYSWYVTLNLSTGEKKTYLMGTWDIRPNIPDVTVYERRNYN
jgi:hypothetical protein